MTTFAVAVLAGMLAGTPPAVASGTLIEAETFQATADWEVQAKLPGFSGEGYLGNRRRMLIAPTHPSLKLILDRAGTYDVWVRALIGGSAESGFHDREFSVEVNGTRLPPTHLGTEGYGFVWELAGQVTVGEDRAVELRLCDVGRAEAAVDCLRLSDDPQFRPAGWTGNSTRPGQGPYFRLPQVALPAAQPFALPPAERQHVETLGAAPHTYEVTMGGTLDEFNTARYPDTYGGSKRLDWGFQPNEYLVLENVGASDVVDPRIVIDGRRDWFSAETILAGILKPGMSDAEKALAIWAFTASIEVQGHENNRRVGILLPDVRSHPSRNSFRERGDPVKAANCYYCSGCQYGATTCAVLARCAGLPARCVWMCPFDQYENHCVAEVFYDGRWHLLDPEARAFYLEADNRTLASYESLHRQPELAARTHEGGFAAKPMAKSHTSLYERYYPSTGMPIDRWTSTMTLTLRPGEKIVWRWGHEGKFRCGQNMRNSNLLPYHLATGKLIYKPDLRSAASLGGVLAERNVKRVVEDGATLPVHADTPGLASSVTYKMQSPYPIVGGVIGGRFVRKDRQAPLRILLSIDDSDWTEIWSAKDDETGSFERYLAIDAVLGGKFAPERCACYVKYEFEAPQSPDDVGLESVYLELDLQMAATSLPSLAVGGNEVVYRDRTDGERQVRITHGWRENSATRPPQAPAQPTAPSDRSTVGADALPKLAWSPAEDPDGDAVTGYHVQVSPREDFIYPVSPNFDQLTFSDRSEWPLPVDWLVAGQTYYWRVRACDAQGAWSPWSDAWRFTVGEPSGASAGPGSDGGRGE